jgi:hypothetical protein
MEAKNFRIGNLLTSKGWGNVGAIEGIEITQDGFELKVKGYVHPWEKDKYFDLAPIELDEEWLTKFGFIEETPNEFILRKHPIIFNIHRNLVTGEFMSRMNPNYSILVKSVHQLQNLFFALTKDELELKTECSTCG